MLITALNPLFDGDFAMCVLNVSSHFIRNCLFVGVFGGKLKQVGFLLILEALHELGYFETIALWKC